MLANKSDLCFSYENLERATDYFSDKNKLGQGGSGSVFKASCVLISRFFRDSYSSIS